MSLGRIACSAILLLFCLPHSACGPAPAGPDGAMGCWEVSDYQTLTDDAHPLVEAA